MDQFTLSEQTHGFISSQQWEVAVLPFGATEPHNYHLPYGTDNYQVEAIGSRACAHATKRGGKVLLLPAMPFGVNTNYMHVKGSLALSMTPTTLLKVLADLVDALERQGLRKLVLLNGHGGNELKPLMRELHHRTKMFLSLCDWFRMAADEYPKIFEHPGEHADEVETSLMMELRPDLVQMEKARPGKGKSTKFEAINQGWVSITRPWHLLTADTGVGDPAGASAEKGRKLMELLTQRLGDYLYELSAAKMDETFPYG